LPTIRSAGWRGVEEGGKWVWERESSKPRPQGSWEGSEKAGRSRRHKRAHLLKRVALDCLTVFISDQCLGI
jgi:hypothetical protein